MVKGRPHVAPAAWGYLLGFMKPCCGRMVLRLHLLWKLLHSAVLVGVGGRSTDVLGLIADRGQATGVRGPSGIPLGRSWLAWQGIPQTRPHQGVSELKQAGEACGGGGAVKSTEGVTSPLGTDTREVIVLPGSWVTEG